MLCTDPYIFGKHPRTRFRAIMLHVDFPVIGITIVGASPILYWIIGYFISIPCFIVAEIDSLVLSSVIEQPLKHIISEPAHEISVLIALSRSESLDESAHMRLLVRAFAARIHKKRM